MPDPDALSAGQDAAAQKLRALAGEAAGLALAAVLREGLPVRAEVDGVAAGDGVQVVVFIAPDSPWRLTPEEAAAIRAACRPVAEQTQSQSRATVTQTPRRQVRDREIERTILEAAPAFDAAPVTMKALARLAGYGYNPHFRDAVDGLVEAGLLVRTRAGVRRADRPQR